MKKLIQFISISVIGCGELNTASKKQKKEIYLYFINDKVITLRPGQITESEFWGNHSSLDSIKFEDSTGEYVVRFNALQDTVLYSSGEIDLFPHIFCFVYIDNNKIDTLYADGALTLFEWKTRKKFYKDNTSFFKTKFAALAHY
jgi:hypothetical protein